MHLSRPPRRAAGFTLIEALVTVTILGLLLAAAAPDFAKWVRNTRVRSVSQALQDGLRLAQAEATRRNRQVVFTLINGTQSFSATPVSSGNNWLIFTVPLLSGDVRELIQGGAVADQSAGVLVGGPVAICFNSAGRLVANASTGMTGATCTVNTAAPLTSYDVTATNADRPLRVTVSLAGQVRLCDPARAQSATAADGCP